MTVGGSPVDYAKILHDYGWSVVLLLLLVKEIVPPAIRTFFPQFTRRQQADINMAVAEQKHRHEMETRTTFAVEKISETNESIRVFMSSIHEQLADIKKILEGPKAPRKRRSS